VTTVMETNETNVVKWDSERRKQALATAISNEVRSGWNVQSQSDYQAVMHIPAQKTNHVLHLILTILTLGLWVVVWIAMVVIHKGEQHEVVSVDEYGNTNIQK
jgi:hypothetical protein